MINSMINSESRSGNFRKVPHGPLGLIALQGSRELGNLVDGHLIGRRRKFTAENPRHISFPGFLRESYLVPVSCCRFATGEGKAVVNETVRGHDIFILAGAGRPFGKNQQFPQQDVK
jgi:ribose-phosphate pyrophosphokinase